MICVCASWRVLARELLQRYFRPHRRTVEIAPELFSNVEKRGKKCPLFSIRHKRLEYIANDSNFNRRAVPSINFRAMMRRKERGEWME